MNFNQVTVESIINPSFQLIDQEFAQNNRKQYNHQPVRLFYFKANTPYLILKDDNVSHFSSMAVKIMDHHTDLATAAQLIEDDPAALIKNQKNDLIGYITPSAIIEKLLNEHGKLNAYIDTILNTLEDSCTVIDESANVVYWTKGAEKIFDITKEEIIGQPITDHFTRENLELLNVLETGESVYRKQHYAREDLAVLINSNPIVYKNNMIGAVVSETDITHLIHLNNELYKTSELLFDFEEKVRKSSNNSDPFSYIKGSSVPLQQTIDIARKAAATDASVLIYGESGVGKELFAKAVHYLRETENAPFIAINCGAISSSLFESEIFGYEKGAFSGADVRGKKGKAELARGGTLFLDEIGEMPLEMQVKFLRLLEEKKFFRVGGTKEIEVDFRVIAATNKDLKKQVDKGEFREDLYYRLNVFCFTVPPLRKRPLDIIELTHYFIYEISTKYHRPIHGISQDVMQALLNHSWPGNIRELKNVLERMVVFSDHTEITSENLPMEVKAENEASPSNIDSLLTTQSSPLSLRDQLKKYEKNIILRELKLADGNKLQCAKNLNITRATLYNRMNKLGIDY